MILYYALGGGIGQITRALAVLHTLKIRENVLVVSPLDSAVTELIPAQFPAHCRLIKPPAFSYSERHKLAAYIQQLIDEYQPSELIVDSFPMGIYGELTNISYSGIRTYLARLLIWERYTKVTGNQFFIFNQTFTLEPLHEDQHYIADRISETCLPLQLTDPPQSRSLPSITDLDQHWLVLHSGPDEEVDDLVTYAKQIRDIEQKQNPLLLVTPSAINKWAHQPVRHLRYYPAQLLMPHVDKIITACGFNTLRQAKAFRHKHHFFPFARRFDDQYFRAALYRSSTARQEEKNKHNQMAVSCLSEDGSR